MLRKSEAWECLGLFIYGTVGFLCATRSYKYSMIGQIFMENSFAIPQVCINFALRYDDTAHYSCIFWLLAPAVKARGQAWCGQ